MAEKLDQQLIEHYLTKGSEDAFRKLVDRYLPLVHSVAFRVTANSEAASDVAQKVFCKLVQRAAHLPSDQPLTAWLHRVAHNVSVDYVRSEVRRQRRERVAAEITMVNTENAQWHQITPIIDQAINSLVKEDRAVVLLRFYENRSYSEIAGVLGISGDAARMKANRALEKLRIILGRHHITTSSSLLALALSANAITTPPVNLASTIINGSVSAAHTSIPFLTNFTLMTKPQILALAACLISASVIGFRQYRVSSLQSENEILKASQQTPVFQVAQVQKAGPTSKRTAHRRTVVASRKKNDITSDLEAIFSRLGSRHPARRSMITEIFRKYPREEVFTFCQELKPAENQALLMICAMTAHGADSPLECFLFASQQATANQPVMSRAVLMSWLGKNPDEALAWFLEHELKETPLLGDARFRDSLSAKLTRAVANSVNAEDAFLFAQKLTGHRRREGAIDMILEQMRSKQLVEFSDKIIAHSETGSIRSLGIEKIAERLASQDIKLGKEWVTTLKAKDPSNSHAAIEGVAKAWMKTDAKVAATWWIQNGNPDKKDGTYLKIVNEWAESAPIQCAEWLGSQPKHPSLDRALAAFSESIAERDPDSARAWAQEISDENLRAVVESSLKIK